MRLAASLALEGFGAWTPVETQRVRIPRMNARRVTKLAMMPGFVFAPAERVGDLSELANASQGRLRLMLRCDGEDYAYIRDREFDPLRKIEARRTPPTQAEKAYLRGSLVRVTGGICGGMTGEVHRGDKVNTLVCFNGRYLVKINTSLLQTNALDRFQSATGGPAALAA
jgi:hypothetical protein